MELFELASGGTIFEGGCNVVEMSIAVPKSTLVQLSIVCDFGPGVKREGLIAQAIVRAGLSLYVPRPELLLTPMTSLPCDGSVPLSYSTSPNRLP